MLVRGSPTLVPLVALVALRIITFFRRIAAKTKKNKWVKPLDVWTRDERGATVRTDWPKRKNLVRPTRQNAVRRNEKREKAEQTGAMVI